MKAAAEMLCRQVQRFKVPVGGLPCPAAARGSLRLGKRQSRRRGRVGLEGAHVTETVML